jgi:hypothetical protein
MKHTKDSDPLFNSVYSPHGKKEEDTGLVLESNDVPELSLGASNELGPPVVARSLDGLGGDARAVAAANLVRGEEEEARDPTDNHDDHKGNVGALELVSKVTMKMQCHWQYSRR